MEVIPVNTHFQVESAAVIAFLMVIGMPLDAGGFPAVNMSFYQKKIGFN